LKTNRLAWLLGAATLLLHLATMSRYGYQTDELYFIDCAKHLAWGYVDQPPLAPFFVWLTAPAGFALWAIRLAPSIAAALAVVVACQLARELGGKRIAQLATGIAVALSPVDLGFGYGLTTSSLEPLMWTLVALFTLRLLRTRDPRWFLASVAVAVVSLYMKYTIALELLALTFGLAVSRQRELLRSRYVVFAALAIVVLTAPNWLWQLHHGMPIFDVLHDDQLRRFSMRNGLTLESPNPVLNGFYFVFAQFFYTGPGSWILWVTGIVALLRSRMFAECRTLGYAYAIIFLALILLAGRGYYIAGYYPVLTAAGAVWLEAALRSAAWRRAIPAATLLLSLPMLPLSLPVFTVDGTVKYGWYLGLERGSPDGLPHLIAPQFALEFGWEQYAGAVYALYKELPPEKRARTTIFSDAYGLTGALNFYGKRYGMPNVISANNNYYLWGYDGWDGKTLLAVGATDHDVLTNYFGRVELLATFWNDYRWVEEGALPVYYCSEPRASKDEIWRALRRYGV